MKQATNAPHTITPQVGLLLILSIVIFYGCDGSTDPLPQPPEPAPCKDYSLDSNYQDWNSMLPEFTFKGGQLNSDGSILAYLYYASPNELGEFNDGKIYLCQLRTGKQIELPKLSWQDSVRYGSVYGFQWCPYDPDLLLVDIVTKVDTSGDVNNAAHTSNSYIVNLDGKVLRRVTPSVFPWYGAPLTYGDVAYQTIAWYPNSTPEADSLCIRMLSPNVDPIIYIPQTETSILPPYYPFCISRDGNRWYGSLDIQDPFGWSKVYRVNSLPFSFSGWVPISYIASFSPSGKYLAVEGWNSTGLPYNEDPNVWILDVDAWSKNPSENAPVVSILSFRRDFCTYTAYGISPVFLTDTTLAVSMYPAFAHISHYYEVGIYGTYIRQLSGKY